MLRETFFALTFGALVGACSSPVPSTSSSSHWVQCKSDDDCTSVPDATSCSSGYCVDRSGSRVEQPASTGNGPAACNPLAGPLEPITLGDVIAVGKDSKGVTYAADEITSMSLYRVFMSDGKILQRRRLLGSAMNLGRDGSDYRFDFDAGDTQEALLIGLHEHSFVSPGMTGTNAMALGPVGTKDFLGGGAAVTTMLTVEDPSVLSGFTLRNLPGDVTIEYVADVEDGSVIVVTHPAVDWDYTDFRMFYGQPPKLQERHVTNTSRAKSGSTVMVFDVAGATYTASLPWVMEATPDGGLSGHPDNGTLDEGNGDTLGITQRWPTPTTLTPLSFTCL